MSNRLEFDRKTKQRRFAYCGGYCEGCGAKLMPGHFQYDHDKEANDSGDNSFENCRCLCTACHKLKTKKYIQETRKAERVRDRHIGAMPKSKRPIGRPKPKRPCSDVNKWFGYRGDL